MVSTLQLMAQQKITGRVIDEDGFAVSYASVQYRGHKIAVSSDSQGKFSIEKHPGWVLTVSALSYKSQTISVNEKMDFIEVKLKDDSHKLNEVVVKTKRSKYSRKDNPAVELMRRVIAAKKKTDLSNHDYYQYDKYQKITLALNDLKKEQLEGKFFSKRQYLLDQVETSPYNGKLTLPVSIDETVSQHIYRKDPKTEKDIIKGQQSNGIGQVIQTGEILNTALKDAFTDVDIYDDYVRLLQYPFPSPIGRTGISFYHYYIEDTVYVERDLCYHLQFIPANSQDFGFRGELYVLADSSLHVKKCNLYMPHNTDVNYVKNMKIEQEYTRLDNGEWVLSKDDMIAELHVNSMLQDLLVVRNTRLTDYAFDELPKILFKGKAKVRHDMDAMNRDEAYWNKYRQVDLTKSESSMDSFIHRMENSKGFKYIIFFVKALMENYVEIGGGTDGKKSKFDLGPVNTYISKNFVDGIRLRLAGRTMAALNPHFFWDGYAAYGTKSNDWYTGNIFTYSLNKKKNSPFEFPMRNLTFEVARDVTSPSDENLLHNKDNFFMTFRAATQDEMFLYHRQKLAFTYETDWGFRFNTSLRFQSNRTVGNLHYYHLDGTEVKKIRMTDLNVGINYNPGVTYVNTKQQRLPINLDSPEIGLSHTMGFRGFMGGQYHSNITKLSIYKRQWLGSWGYLDFHAIGQAQWNKVPFPMLILPPINLSYFEQETTISLMKDWEFLNDRQVFWALSWDMNGKLLNRIPLIKKLKWREWFAIKGVWGHLTDKNNPYLEKNQGDGRLFKFPKNSHVMNDTPYWECVAGVHNIFKFFSVEYVRRLTYLNNNNIDKWGIRFGFMMSF
ncbi:carboxypeptidase-like regulatory domain-containing protein [Segatella hominis]|uniref:Carboxypeptidase-like regulatory domain-containing protein n=1 Tax=Segatella hominis TaxID=2518605 RepID=A0A4Y8VL38_9BACT|nr:carboxypeptidase-like regulatory domain-containing protein [Segatella hominis]